MSTQPTDSDAHAMRTGECIGSDNDAEWRDLQNAQLLSMQGVWDNPADELWNSIPPDTDLADWAVRRARLRQAQTIVLKVVPACSPSVVAELIAERRAEAARE